MFGKSKTFVAASALALSASGALAQDQEGLVNLSVDGNTVQVPIDVAANVCDVDVNVLAEQASAGDTACEIDEETAAANGIATGDDDDDDGDDEMENDDDMAEGDDDAEESDEAEEDENEGGEQRGLVNVSVDGNTVQVPIGVAANVCGADANVLAQQQGSGETVCEIDQQTAAENNIGTGSNGNGNAGGDQQGLVNVSVDGNTVQVPVNVAANVCDVDVNVLARQQGSGETACEIDQETAAENGIGQ